MSKAFTREDDGVPPEPEIRGARGPVSALGARLARAKLAELDERRATTTDVQARAILELESTRFAALADARVAPLPVRDDVAAFGAHVRIRDAGGRERVVALVSAEEVGLVPNAASITSPIAHALVGARAGEVVEVGGLERAGGAGSRSPTEPVEWTLIEVWYP